MTGKWIRRLIVDFKQWGGDGMEVADSGQTKDQRQYLARLANEYDLAASLGSDFHFPCGWIELGKNLFLPEEVKPIWTLLNNKGRLIRPYFLYLTVLTQTEAR